MAKKATAAVKTPAAASRPVVSTEIRNSPVPKASSIAASKKEISHQMIAERVTRLVPVHLEQRLVRRPAPGDQDVVDRCGQAGEELAQRRRVGRVERRGAGRADLAGRLLEPVRMPGGQDDVGPLGPCAPGRLQPDAGAAADQDDGLPGQFGSGAHDSPWPDMTAICASIGRIGRGMSAISIWSATNAVL